MNAPQRQRSALSLFLFGLPLLLALLGMLMFASAPTSALAANAANTPTATPTPPPPPVLLSPFDSEETTINNFPPAGMPSFEWQAIPGVTLYRIQVSNNIGFSSTPINITTANSRYTPVALLADGVYYWRVRAERIGTLTRIGDYSEIRQFTKSWKSPDNAPQLLQPSAEAQLQFFGEETFSWTSIPGATRYHLQIALSPDDFELNKFSYKAENIYNNRHQPATKLANGTYYWRIVPVDAGSVTGTPSEIRRFDMAYNDMPLLLEPQNDAILNFTPTFSWAAMPGAERYLLEYATNETFTTDYKSIDTRNTSYTPDVNLLEQKKYYWRVRVKSGLSFSQYSEVRSFEKRWDMAPQLLTPPNNFSNIRIPVFSWTPVPGAASYRIEINSDIGFGGDTKISDTTSNTFYVPEAWAGSGSGKRMFWRVTPLDAAGRAGKVSNTFELTSDAISSPVVQVYPEFYYNPDPLLTSHEDRTVPLPLFIWQRPTTIFLGMDFVWAYLVEVSQDINFESVLWQSTTHNQSAAPTVENPFEPVPGQDYFWRVTPLDSQYQPMDYPSQVWRARFNPAAWINLDTATVNTAPPVLLRPQHGYEVVETAPTLEWRPIRTPLPEPVFYADSYQVQISVDPSFAAEYLLVDQMTPYPVYAPTEVFARRLNGQYRFGSFYWRVKAYRGGSEMTSWSETRRFQIAAQTQWRDARDLGQLENRELMTWMDEPNPDTAYQASKLYVTQDQNDWFIGFEQELGPDNLEYVIYIDLDHKDNSGASFDAKGYNLSAISGHRPEYAVYVPESNREFASNQVRIYRWNASQNNWEPYNLLSNVGGDIFPAELYGVIFNQQTPTWAVGQYGDILRFQDGQWWQRYSPTLNTLYAVDAYITPNSNHTWAAGVGGFIRYIPGQGWSKPTGSTTATMRAFRILNSTNGWAVGANGSMAQYDDEKWVGRSTLTTRTLHAVDFITSTIQTSKHFGLAVGDFGAYLRWNTTTSKWENQTAITNRHLYGLDLVNDNFGMAVGQAGEIYQWNGSGWVALDSPVSVNLNAVAMYSESLGLAVGDEGTILQWDGAQWQLVSPGGLYLDLYALDFNETGDQAMIVGENGENILWDNGQMQQVSKTIAKYLELRLPSTAIGMQDSTGSAAIAVMVMDSASGNLLDTLPGDAQAAQNGFIRFFANASERMNALMLPDNALLGAIPQDPTVFASLHPFSFDFPLQSNWGGYIIQIAQDIGFNTIPSGGTVELKATRYYGLPQMAWPNDLKGDDLYYWRVRPRYLNSSGQASYGAWSQPHSYRRVGLQPQNLRTSMSFATPSFSWDMVEGASKYLLQVGPNANFTNLIISNKATELTSYTHSATLNPGTYYWRVQVQRNNNVTNDWSEPQSFTIELPSPTNLRYYPAGIDPAAFPAAPTLCWDHLLQSLPGNEPALAAWRYNVQISQNPSFSSVYDGTVTEQTCWTSGKALPDGTYYWRVAMQDGQGTSGPFSDTLSFTKQFPAPTLISPLTGSESQGTPTFTWSWMPFASSYRLQISTDPLFGTFIFNGVTPYTTYTPIILVEQTTFYWRVAMIADGKQGPFNTEKVIIGAAQRSVYLPFTRR